MKKRCEWAKHESMVKYHDKEWGIPVHNDKKLFEMLILEGAQAGLSWSTILKRRKAYKKAFDGFDLRKISKYNKKDIKRLLNDEGIIRNRLKILSAIENARKVLGIKREFGSFDNYIWGFVNKKPVQNRFKKMGEIPANTNISDEMSKDLKKRGFKFVGTTICYAFMQAVGMTNDHITNCFRHKTISRLSK